MIFPKTEKELEIYLKLLELVDDRKKYNESRYTDSEVGYRTIYNNTKYEYLKLVNE